MIGQCAEKGIHMKDKTRSHRFRDSHQDMIAASASPQTPQTQAPAYRLAFNDPEFLTRDELRPMRLQLELMKPQIVMDERGVQSTIVIFGSARIREAINGVTPKSAPPAAMAAYYDQARRFAALMTERSLKTYGREFVVMTGGGPGIMEAGNRGADDAGGQSIGLNIVLPHEQAPNPYVTPDLCFNFHYFAMRKMHFLMRSRAVAVFPGGFGTLDETFEALTLVQTGRMRPMPFLLFGKAYWQRLIDWDLMVENGFIAQEDLALFSFVETAEEAVEIIDGWVDQC